MANSVKTNAFGAIESSDANDDSGSRNECTYIMAHLTTRHDLTRAKLGMRLLPVSYHHNSIVHPTPAGAFVTSDDYARDIHTLH